MSYKSIYYMCSVFKCNLKKRKNKKKKDEMRI